MKQEGRHMSKSSSVINTKSAVFKVIMLVALAAIGVYTAIYLKNVQSLDGRSSAGCYPPGSRETIRCSGRRTGNMGGTQSRQCLDNGQWTSWSTCR